MDIRAILMGTGFALMWSSAFTSAKIAVLYAPPLAILSVRFLISGALALILAKIFGHLGRLTTKQWVAVVLFGVCQNVIYLGSNFVAAQWIDASLAVIIASLLPLLVAGVSWLFLGERLPVAAVFGLIAGLAGVLVIMWDRLGSGADPLGIAIVCVGVAALTVATLLVRGAASGGKVLMIVGLQMWVGSLILFPISLATEVWVIDWQWPLILAFSYTTLIPGLLATVTWFFLVQRIGPTRAATFHFLNPFLGVAIASLILSEGLSVQDVVGVGVIMAGILSVQLSRAT